MPELPKSNGELFPFLSFLFSVLFFSFNQIDYKAWNRMWPVHFTFFLLNGKLVRSENVVAQHTRLQKLLNVVLWPTTTTPLSTCIVMFILINA